MLTRPAVRADRTSILPNLGKTLTRERIYRYPLLLLTVTTAIYLLTLLRSGHWVSPDGRMIGEDYLAFYMAGDMVNQGQLGQLYDLAAQKTYQQRLMQQVNPQWTGTCLYLNPPHYAWAMSLLASLGYGPSLVAWWLLSSACFVASTLLWRRWLAVDHFRIAVLVTVCSPPWFWALAGGQNTFFSLLILTAFCSLLFSGRETWSGLVLSLLAYKFQLLIIPAGLLLCKRRWRAMGGLAIGGSLTLLFTVWQLGGQCLMDYARFGLRLGELMQFQGFDVGKQHSWHGFFALMGAGWMSPACVRALAIAASGGSIALLASIWRGRWSPRSASFSLQLAALVVATLLTSPHLFHYDMLLAALPAVLWYRTARRDDDALTSGKPLSAAPPPMKNGDETITATGDIRTLLAIGFCWLAISPIMSPLLKIQFSTLLLLSWLLVARAALERMKEMPRPSHEPVAPQGL